MKKLFIILSLIYFSTLTFALPGVKSLIPDQSGQFVYYKDSSFERESYFGIITFDEGTYGVRYFAPAVKDSYPLIPKKDIYILFTMDPAKNYVDLTGERILSPISPADTDIVNYLHDMIYELTARRQKAGVIDSFVSINQEYEQFGGDVLISFDPLIPLFNIKSIVDSKNKTVFNLITCGRLVSDKDDHFVAFEGLPVKVEDEHSLKLDKKAKKTKIQYSKTPSHTQKITLDTQWSENAENLFYLDDNAIIVFDIFDFSAFNSAEEKEQQINLFKRNFSNGTQGLYPYIENSQIEEKNNTIKVTNLFFNDESKAFTKDYKILTKLDENTYAFMSLTVFQGAYSKNSKYFESIIKSYSAN